MSPIARTHTQAACEWCALAVASTAGAPAHQAVRQTCLRCPRADQFYPPSWRAYASNNDRPTIVAWRSSAGDFVVEHLIRVGRIFGSGIDCERTKTSVPSSAAIRTAVKAAVHSGMLLGTRSRSCGHFGHQPSIAKSMPSPYRTPIFLNGLKSRLSCRKSTLAPGNASRKLVSMCYTRWNLTA